MLIWRNLKFVSQLRVKIHKFRINDQSEKSVNLGADNRVW
jgi:hypothetical protein